MNGGLYLKTLASLFRVPSEETGPPNKRLASHAAACGDHSVLMSVP